MTDDGPTTPYIPPMTLVAPTESTGDTEEAASLSVMYGLGEAESKEVEKHLAEFASMAGVDQPVGCPTESVVMPVLDQPA